MKREDYYATLGLLINVYLLFMFTKLVNFELIGSLVRLDAWTSIPAIIFLCVGILIVLQNCKYILIALYRQEYTSEFQSTIYLTVSALVLYVCTVFANAGFLYSIYG